MKKRLLSVFAVAVCAAASANDYAREVLEEFLDARIAESPVRYARAAKNVAALAAEGSPLHQYVLAVASKEPDFPRSVELAEKDVEYYLLKNKRKIAQLAERDDNALAYYLLSLDRGDGNLLRKAARGGSVYALNELGMKLVDEVNSRKHSVLSANKKFYESFECFSRAAGKRDPTALYNLGVCYLNGYGCTRDAAKAIENFTRAADMNHPMAMNALGELYRDGVEVEHDAAKAFALFSDSAKSGNSFGQYNYAMSLLKDSGAAGTNAAAAVSLLEKSAKQRNVKAMNEYAKCLYDSVGVDFSATNSLEGAELDEAKAALEKADAERARQAVAWWLHCADRLRYPDAMHNLAKCFADGRGVDRNDRAAVVWFRRAADCGHVPSMFSLAECCENGIGGLEKSHYNANWWKTRAHAELGDRNARIWLGSNKLK